MSELKLPVTPGEPMNEVELPGVISVSLFDERGFFGRIYGISAKKVESIARDLVIAVNSHQDLIEVAKPIAARGCCFDNERPNSCDCPPCIARRALQKAGLKIEPHAASGK